MASAGARAYNWGLGGGAPSGVQGQSPWWGPVEVAELPHSTYFAKSINQALANCITKLNELSPQHKLGL